MGARDCLACALIAGLTYSEALGASPGLIYDMYAARQKYDDALHHIKRKNPCAWEEE